MNFLIDAHLPRSLCTLLAEAGHNAVHTEELRDQNRTKDSQLNDISVNDQRVLVTKDTDFYHSHLLHGRPWKLVLVRTGNMRTRELKALFERHLSAIICSLDQNSFIELYRERVNVVR